MQETQVWSLGQKDLWRRGWVHTLVFLPGEFHGQRSLSSVQSLSCVWLFATPWIAARQASLSITNSWSWLKLMFIESAMPSSHLILCRPLLLLPLIPPSIRVFSNESNLHMRWPKYWSFSLSISPSNEHPGLSSFRMGWLDLPAVQEALNSLLQHHSSKASILQRSAFFTVQLSHPYMSTGKTIALTKALTDLCWQISCKSLLLCVSTTQSVPVCLSCFSHVQLSVALWTLACQAPFSLGSSR